MIPEIVNSIGFAVYSIAAVSSQSVLDISTFVLLITTLYIIRRNPGRIAFTKIGIEWAFLGYVIVVVLGFIFNSSPDAEWLRSASKFSWVINIYILIYSFQVIKIESSSVLKTLSILSLGPTIYSLVSYIHGTDLLTGRSNERITGLVNSATYHAHGNSFILVFMIGCFLISYKRLSRTWIGISILSIFLLGLSIVFTFTRGIWGSLFFSSLVVLSYFDWKKAVKFVVVSCLIGGLTFLSWDKFKDRILSTIQSSGDSQRISLFLVNVQMWREYPLLGIGYGENLRRNREYWDRPEWNKPSDYITSHAHNQYLNVLATTGIFGLIFFCCFFFFFLVKNYQLLRRTNFEEYPERFSFLIVTLWAQWQFAFACLTDVSFEYAKIRGLILLVWALVIAIDQKPGLVKESNHA